MRGVTWKYKKSINRWEGKLRNDTEPVLFIYGSLCVSDVRESKPKNYKITGLSIKDAKELAEDLVNNTNVEKHEINKLNYEYEQNRSAELIERAQQLLKNL